MQAEGNKNKSIKLQYLMYNQAMYSGACAATCTVAEERCLDTDKCMIKTFITELEIHDITKLMKISDLKIQNRFCFNYKFIVS